MLAILYIGLVAIAVWYMDRLAATGSLRLMSDGKVISPFWWMGALITFIFLGLWLIRLMVWRSYRPWSEVSEARLPGLSVIVPCFNEGPGIARTIESIGSAAYPRDRLELIVVDDGSLDDSATWAVAALQQIPFAARFIRLPHNCGKRYALACAMKRARGEIWFATDSDCQIESQALRRIVAPLVRDPKIGLVAGHIRVHSPVNWLQRLLDVSFEISFDWGRAIQSRIGQVLCVPGAAAAYRASAVRPVMDAWLGYSGTLENGVAGAGTPPRASGGRQVGEDRELTNRLLDAGWRSVYQSTAMVRTKVPATLSGIHRLPRLWLVDIPKARIPATGFPGGGVWGMYLRWARGDVRESYRYTRRLLGRRRGMRLADGYFLLLILEGVMPYAWLTGAALLIIDNPLWIGVVPAMVVIGSLLMTGLYAVAYQSRNALYVPLQALLWPVLHGWTGLVALCTPHRHRWLTRF